jgi:endonuclease/exonuclease/phosphatase family metal-dependent hydrolase
MRIVTYNIHRTIGVDGREDAARIAAVLQELDADIVALQEAGYQSGIPGNVLEYLGASMQAQVIEGTTFQDERGHYGNAVLSRIPLHHIQLHDISVPGREPRGAIELSLQIDTIEVQIIATHLGLRPGERRYQIRRLLQLHEVSSARVKILLGDLNEWFLWGRPLRWLYRIFGHMPAPATFPARRPWFALDRLWVKPMQVVNTLQVHNSSLARQASDHLPLVAELDIKELDGV